MTAPLIVLFAALVVFIYLLVVDEAAQVLSERAGIPFNEERSRWTRGLVLAVIGGLVLVIALPKDLFEPPPPTVASYTADSLWLGPDTLQLAYLDDEREALVRYGRELVHNTSAYFGPKGSVAPLTNGMDCENCHLDAGTKPWGNNYGAVWSTYPKFRERSGAVETAAKRVNDCFERSLNGTALDTASHEMKAILAYMEWLGSGIKPKQKPKGSGIVELAFLDRPADTTNGAAIYTAKCVSCHQADGQGAFTASGTAYQYPPLWGAHSYNIGAGLYRLSRFAGYVKANMPQGATWENPLLSDEEAWDVAAYINSRQRPDRDLSKDWPKVAGKPVDHPFGPYADSFPEIQHKFGPFGPIAEARKTSKP
ncbi:MAG: c-type cytochrome [Flavobacteriales bacterium]|nr:c-type cytochrome [Flavobacteriales bacterium]MBK9288127.1 c-type cytochrome [Flavobacteriales bacterium]MBL0036895.1 c-type cytochrome [Flavobacteriales bacterium]